MMGNKSFVFRFADVEVREREFSLIKAAQVLPVEPKAFRVLLFLLRNPQKLITKEELLNAVWGDAAVTENSLTRSIALLRRLLGDEARTPRFIETVATVGYRFIDNVEVSEDAPGEPRAEVANGLSAAGKEVGSRNRLWGWALAGGGVLVFCLAGAIWYLHRPLPQPRITGYNQITHDGRQKILVGTDGSRLYFNLMSGPMLPRSIAQVAISGGGIAPIPVALYPTLSCWTFRRMDPAFSFVRTQDYGMWESWEASLATWEMPFTRPFHRTETPWPSLRMMTSTSWGAMGQEPTNCHMLETSSAVPRHLRSATSPGLRTAVRSGLP
jgi:DNA-binding winged helix-turn-helix (wHTH) protein